MRKICSSSKTSWTSLLSALALSRSVPNGFSMITRARSARPASPISRITSAAALGGTLRWYRRRGSPPSSRSARSTAAVSARGPAPLLT